MGIEYNPACPHCLNVKGAAHIPTEPIAGLTECEVCGKVAENEDHPCSFESGCTCWRGKACGPPLPAFDAHDERTRELTQSLIDSTQARLDNAL